MSKIRLLILTALTFFGASLIHAKDQPNILFIAIDDLNDWVGHLAGHPQAKTPHIDRLAERGLSLIHI